MASEAHLALDSAPIRTYPQHGKAQQRTLTQPRPAPSIQCMPRAAKLAEGVEPVRDFILAGTRRGKR